jgi:hypothetical protein
MRIGLLLASALLAQITLACCGRVNADIRYTLLTGSTYRIDVISFTCLSMPFDVPELNVSIDGAEQIPVPRTLIQDEPSSDLRRSEYTFEHAFVGTGWHTVDATLGGRGAGVANIPNSISVPACLRAMILVDPMIGTNTSIQYNTPPNEWTQSWNTFVHTPGPFDADGDSLVFDLIVPRGYLCEPIAGYQFPVGANFTWLDPGNGTFLWDYPVVFGEFAIAIQGSEYRNGQLLGRVTRDMSICVQPFTAGFGETPVVDHFAIRPTLAMEELIVDAQGSWTVEILDASGRLCSTLRSDGIGSIIPLTGLGAGSYSIRASDGAGTLRHGRFVKVQ